MSSRSRSAASRLCLMAAFLLAATLSASAVRAQAVIQASVSGGTVASGQQFQVAISVSENDTGRLPKGAALRVTYDKASVDFVSVSPSEFDQVFPTSEQSAGGTAVYRDMQAQDATNGNFTPEMFVITFEVAQSPVVPFSIGVADNPGSTTPLLGEDFRTNINHTFDLSGVTDIGVAPSPSLSVGSGMGECGEEVTIALSVADVTSLSNFTVDLSYDESCLTFSGASAGPAISGWDTFDVMEPSLGQIGLSAVAGAGSAIDGTGEVALLTFICGLTECDCTSAVTADSLGGGLSGADTSAGSVQCSTPDPGSATVATQLLDQGPFRAGEAFGVSVLLTENTTGRAPGGYALRINYNANSVVLESASAGDMGTPVLGSQQGSGAGAYKTLTGELLSNTSELPVLAGLQFRVVAGSPVSPFSITVEDDQEPANSLYDGSEAGIDHDFDASATTGLLVDTSPEGEAVVATSIVSGNPGSPGSEFRVAVSVQSNTTSLFPNTVAHRVTFDTDSVSYLGAIEGDLGSTLAADTETIEGSRVFFDIVTFGNAANEDLTPVCYTLRFRVNDTPATPFSIAVLDDPGSTNPLLATDFLTGIPHTYDTSATANIGGGSPSLGISAGSDSVICAEEELVVPVWMTQAGEVDAFSFTIGYPGSCVTFERVEAGLGTAGWESISANESPAGTVTVTGTAGDAGSLFGDAQIARLVFMCQPAVCPCNGSITFDSTGGDLAGASTSNGSLTCQPPTIDATISTEVRSPSPYTRGSILEVGLEVSENEGEVPDSFDLRLEFENTHLEFNAAIERDFGNFATTPGPGSVRIRGSRIQGSSPTPDLVTVRFLVRNNAPETPFSVEALDNLGGEIALADAEGDPITHEFDNSATADLPLAVIDGSATIAGEIVVGDPSEAGETFDILVAIPENTTGLAPGGAELRVRYDTTSVEFIQAAAGDLGDVTFDGEEPAGGTLVTRDIATATDSGNSSETPNVFTVRFRVLDDPVVPFSILFSDDPDSDVPLIAGDSTTSIPHVYVNSGTSNLGLGSSAAEVAVGAVESQCSQTAEVPVTVAGAQHFGDFALELAYDPGCVTFDSVVPGAQTGDWQLIQATVPTPGTLSITGTRGGGTALTGQGEIVKIRFACQPDECSCQSSLTPTALGGALESSTATAGLVRCIDPNAIARIVTELDSPGFLTEGTEFNVLVKVEGHSGNPPTAFALRVHWRNDSLLFLGGGPGDLENLFAGPVENGTGPERFRDFAGFDFRNEIENSTLLNLTFQVRESNPRSPFTVRIEDDPDTNLNLGDIDNTPIEHLFDNSETTDLEVADPPTDVQVATSIRTGNPEVPNSFLDVLVSVNRNETDDVPESSSMRVTYDKASVDYLGGFGQALGSLVVGPEQPISGTRVARVFSTTGNPSNTDPTPDVFLLRFQVLPDFEHPYTIGLSDNPDSSTPLRAIGGSNMLHVIDASATTDIGGPADLELLADFDSNINCGFAFDVPIRAIAALDIDAFGLRFDYNPDCFELIDFQPGTLTSDWDILQGDTSTPGTIDISGLAGSGTDANGDGTLAVATLRSRLDTCPCTSTLTLSNLAGGVSGAIVHNGYAESFDPGTRALIETELASPAPLAPGESFTVRVAVAENETGETPLSYALRVRYPTDSVSLDSITSPDFQQVLQDPAEGTEPDRFIDVRGFGNTAQEPVLMDLSFTILEDDPAAPFTILVENDPETILNLANADNNPIPIEIDSSATIGLPVYGYPGLAVIATEVRGGDPGLPGEEFDLRLNVTSNNTHLYPGRARLILTYDSSSLEVLNSFGGGVGAITLGNEQPAGGTLVTRTLETTGNASNLNLTPAIGALRFRVSSDPAASYSILLEDDPAAAAGLSAVDFQTPVPHVFDLRASDLFEAADAPVLEFGSMRIPCGEAVLVPVYVRGARNLSDFILTLSVSGGCSFIQFVQRGSDVSDWQTFSPTGSSIAASAGSGTPINGEGLIAFAAVRCNAGSCACTGTLGFSNPGGGLAGADTVEGTVECVESLLGDVNGDGQATPVDAQSVFDCYLDGAGCPPGLDTDSGDVCPAGGNGFLTPLDAQGIFLLYLGEDPC